jgi:probable selenium-dependent hydroxylase accessory protein YqeC
MPNANLRNLPVLFANEERQLFTEQFAFQPHSLVNFVGGGGKTTLIHRLMEENCSEGPVLHTTTTRIHPPAAGEGLVVISSDNVPLLQLMVDQVGRCCPANSFRLTVTCHYISPTLLRGVPPNFANAVDRKLFPILLNEADGAAGYSVKFPRESEPVLMEDAEYLVPVIGIDCLGQPLGPDVIFRWEMLAERFSLRAGERMTPELAADILMHKQGVCRHWKRGTRIIPYINKVDDPDHDLAAKDLADALLCNRNFPVARVVFGSAIQGRCNSIAAPQTDDYFTADQQE